MKHKIPKYMVCIAEVVVFFLILLSALYLFRQKEEPDLVENVMSVTTEKILLEARENMEKRESFGRKFEFAETSAPVYSHGAIKIIKDSKFENVGEPPKSMMQQLNSLANYGKRKEAAVELSEDDLKKKIIIESSVKSKTVKSSSVPVLGFPDLHSVSQATMINAPVDYKIFRDVKTWDAFASAHKGEFPDIDFSEKNIVILVSLSNFPPGIFEILDIVKKSKKIIVKYRVNPLAMAIKNVPDKHDYYAAAEIAKSDLPIKLVQTR